MATEKLLEETKEHYAGLMVIAEQILEEYKNKYVDINVFLIMAAMENCNFAYPDGFGIYQLEMAIEEEIKELDELENS